MPERPMSEPTVSCIMLTRDRPELAKKAIECFRGQTYDPCKRMLFILDSGDPSWFDPAADCENENHLGAPQYADQPIGALRNIANGCVEAAILLHWDSDDWSHPNRIAEQVELLQSSGADVVGYKEMLFWRTITLKDPAIGEVQDEEAWLYTGPTAMQTLGTSLCYWRKTWEKKPFNPQLPRGKGGGE